MGLLDQMRQAHVKPELTIVDEAAAVPAEVFEKPVPAPLVEVSVPVKSDLVLKRDPHGFIKSATGINAQGQKVTFDFTRDGKKNLERIKVR